MNVFREIVSTIKTLKQQCEQRVYDEQALSVLEQQCAYMQQALSHSPELYYAMNPLDLFALVLELFHVSQNSLMQSVPRLLSDPQLCSSDAYTLRVRLVACGLVKVIVERSVHTKEQLAYSRDQLYELIQILAFSSRLWMEGVGHSLQDSRQSVKANQETISQILSMANLAQEPRANLSAE